MTHCTSSSSDPAGSPEDVCAKKILSTLACRAYRRPVTDGDMRALLGFYRMGRKQGTFEDGIRMAIERMLVSVVLLAL